MSSKTKIRLGEEWGEKKFFARKVDLGNEEPDRENSYGFSQLPELDDEDVEQYTKFLAKLIKFTPTAEERKQKLEEQKLNLPPPLDWAKIMQNMVAYEELQQATPTRATAPIDYTTVVSPQRPFFEGESRRRGTVKVGGARAGPWLAGSGGNTAYILTKITKFIKDFPNKYTAVIIFHRYNLNYDGTRGYAIRIRRKKKEPPIYIGMDVNIFLTSDVKPAAVSIASFMPFAAIANNLEVIDVIKTFYPKGGRGLLPRCWPCEIVLGRPRDTFFQIGKDKWEKCTYGKSMNPQYCGNAGECLTALYRAAHKKGKLTDKELKDLIGKNASTLVTAKAKWAAHVPWWPRPGWERTLFKELETKYNLVDTSYYNLDPGNSKLLKYIYFRRTSPQSDSGNLIKKEFLMGYDGRTNPATTSLKGWDGDPGGWGEQYNKAKWSGEFGGRMNTAEQNMFCDKKTPQCREVDWNWAQEKRRPSGERRGTRQQFAERYGAAAESKWNAARRVALSVNDTISAYSIPAPPRSFAGPCAPRRGALYPGRVNYVCSLPSTFNTNYQQRFPMRQGGAQLPAACWNFTTRGDKAEMKCWTWRWDSFLAPFLSGTQDDNFKAYRSFVPVVKYIDRTLSSRKPKIDKNTTNTMNSNLALDHTGNHIDTPENLWTQKQLKWGEDGKYCRHFASWRGKGDHQGDEQPVLWSKQYMYTVLIEMMQKVAAMDNYFLNKGRITQPWDHKYQHPIAAAAAVGTLYDRPLSGTAVFLKNNIPKRCDPTYTTTSVVYRGGRSFVGGQDDLFDWMKGGPTKQGGTLKGATLPHHRGNSYDGGWYMHPSYLSTSHSWQEAGKFADKKVRSGAPSVLYKFHLAAYIPYIAYDGVPLTSVFDTDEEEYLFIRRCIIRVLPPIMIYKATEAKSPTKSRTYFRDWQINSGGGEARGVNGRRHSEMKVGMWQDAQTKQWVIEPGTGGYPYYTLDHNDELYVICVDAILMPPYNITDLLSDSKMFTRPPPRNKDGGIGEVFTPVDNKLFGGGEDVKAKLFLEAVLGGFYFKNYGEIGAHTHATGLNIDIRGGRKTRGRKTRGRKTRGRKTRGRKTRGRKTRGRKRSKTRCKKQSKH